MICNKFKMQYLGQTTDQFQSKWNNYKSDSRKHGLTFQNLLYYFCTSDDGGFLEDVSLTFEDKTDPSVLLNRAHYWRSTLKTMAPPGLNPEESV